MQRRSFDWSFVGKAIDPKGIICAEKKFRLEKMLAVTLTPMGGNLVLNKALERDNFATLKENEKNFNKWFSQISPWTPDTVARDKAAWLRVMGVPAHIWGEYSFKQVSLLQGLYIAMDDSTREMTRLDFGRVLISTSSPKFINRVVEVRVNNVTYSIRLQEVSFTTDWKYYLSEGSLSEEDGSLADSSFLVPKTEFTAEIGAEEMQRLNREISNPLFGKATSPVNKGGCSCNWDAEFGGLMAKSWGYHCHL